ncbi:MAG: AMP-binding protein [Granulosicoccus sp.]|nr:AMP-binding protein [Granulosicoccus sp.]
MFDDLDTQLAEIREARLFTDLAQRLPQCVQRCEGLARHLAGCEFESIIDRAALQRMPVLRKSDLMEAQQRHPPFGGFVDENALHGQRVFMSPGPVWEPQLPGIDPWAGARALHAAGLRRGHRVHNAFSYHLTPGGLILDEAARSLGCVVFPAGSGGTESQVQALRQFASEVYVGTPDYLQTLLDHAHEDHLPLASLERAMVSGGALYPAMRRRYEQQGIHVQQCYATADLGVIAYETATDDQVHPGMVVNEGLIVEIVVPGTSRAVAPGEVGELLVTRLHPVYPLLRFATGDLSAEILEPSPCGRTQRRLRGWMGRADQRIKVRGMFVDPVQLRILPEEHPDVTRWRLVVTRQGDRDVMTLSVTLVDSGIPRSRERLSAVTGQLEDTLKRATNLSGDVLVVDTLPDDGVVVDDQRKIETG